MAVFPVRCDLDMTTERILMLNGCVPENQGRKDERANS
jgi:hypothetical protein